MSEFFRVPNLDKWQHYKDRCPPWIKLHRDILNDYEFSCLQDASKAHLISIWLLASQMDNKLPADPKWIANKINATDPVNINILIDKGFIEIIQNDSNTLAQCKQSALVETETETETETKSIYTHDFETAWGKYPKRAGANPKKRAFKAWSARVKEGAQVQSIFDGIDRYAGFIKQTGKASTEFVMQMATFLGPDEHYLEPWAKPTQKPDEIRPRNDTDWMNLGSKIGLTAGRGESMQEYIKRIQIKLRENQHA